MTGSIRAPRTISRALLLGLLAATRAHAQDDAALFAEAGRLLQSHCAMPGCHAGPGAAQGMRLERDEIYRSTVNAHARTDGRFLRVVPGAPEQSLLYRKLLPPAEGQYKGPRMPLSMDPLNPEEIEAIKQWIAAFPPEVWGPPPGTEAKAVTPRTFQDACLINLPASDPIGPRTLEFRILHRFRASAPDAGSAGLYGLDSGAWTSFDLGYGLNGALDLGLRRTDLDRDFEGYAKWAVLRQGDGRSPVSLALRGSVSNVREPGRFNRTRYGAQAVLARRLGERLSLMLVPTYVTHTNTFDPEETSGTGAVGAGAEWRLRPRVALTAEWVGQASGVKAPYQSASIGISMATARHVFHLIATNTQGSQTDQYVTGGDLHARAGDFRLGFNISRTHSFRK